MVVPCVLVLIHDLLPDLVELSSVVLENSMSLNQVLHCFPQLEVDNVSIILSLFYYALLYGQRLWGFDALV